MKKHSKSNTKQSKCRYTYYQNTLTIIKNTHTITHTHTLLRFSRVKGNVHLLNKISSEEDWLRTCFMFQVLFMVSGGNKTLAGTAASGRGLSDVENTKICCGIYRTWFPTSNSRHYSGFIWWYVGVTLLVIVFVAWVGRGGYLHHCLWKITT
jgi:hypothetical protein